jgi:hypothetical protein
MTLTLQGNGTLNGLTVLGAPVTTLANTGTAASPSLVFDGDSDTGLFRPGANQLGFSVGGSARLTIASNGNITCTGSATFTSQVSTSDRFDADRTSATDNVFNGRLNGSLTTQILANGSANFAGNIETTKARSNTGGSANCALLINPSDSTMFFGFRVNQSDNDLVIDSNSASNVIKFGPTGSATFAGSVQAGGNAQSGTAVGTRLNSYGAVHAARTNDSDVTWAGYKVGNNTPTSQITADGSADFSGIITTNSPTFPSTVCQIQTDAKNTEAYSPTTIYNSQTIELHNSVSMGSAIIRFRSQSNNGSAGLWNIGAVPRTNSPGADFVFQSRNTGGNYNESVRLDPNGGIKFNGDTAAANNLDDYEEGTWTPTIKENGTGTAWNTLSAQNGSYTKIGDCVTFAGTLNYSGVATNVNSVFYSWLAGFPYTSSSSKKAGQFFISFLYSGVRTSLYSGTFIAGNAYAGIYKDQDATTPGTMMRAEFPTGAHTVQFQGHYYV